MKPLLQVLALGLGGMLTLRILTPHDVLFTVPTEMNFLLNYWGWKTKKFFRKKKKKGFNYLNKSSTPAYLQKLFTLG
jgi:hypothetical protein